MAIGIRELLVGTENNPRYVSKLGDRRETPVPCLTCRCPTLALDALCDQCSDAKAEARADVEAATKAAAG